MLYRGKAGYVYEVDDQAEQTKVRGIYVTGGEAAVTGAVYIPDAYEAILREIEKGNVRLLPYENLTEEQKMLNHQGIIHLLRNFPMNSRKENFF